MENNKIGLALSGGGVRAAAFHLGTLKKLNELDILDKVDVFSCVSGGAIAGATYLKNKELPFEDFEKIMVSVLLKGFVLGAITSWSFILPFLFTIAGWLLLWYFFSLGVALLVLIILYALYQFKLFPLSNAIAKSYDKLLFEKETFGTLASKPILAINTTNIETGRPWTFSQSKMSDSTYDYGDNVVKFNNNNFPLAKAVAASTCVPFAFSPITIDKVFFVDHNKYKSVAPRLIDGGVFDNQGIHKLTQNSSSYRCGNVIVSDAGQNFNRNKSFNNNISLLLRVSDLFMNRIKNLQFAGNIYYRDPNDALDIMYMSLAWRAEECISGFIRNLKNDNISDTLFEYFEINKSMTSLELSNILKSKIGYEDIILKHVSDIDKCNEIGTHLSGLSESEINNLMSHSQMLTEIQIRLYLPHLL